MRIMVKDGRFGWPLAVVAALVLAAAVMLAAQPAGGATPGDRGVATAQKKLQALYAGTLFKQPPSTSPKPQKGKNVWVVTVGQGSAAGVQWAKGVRDAGAALGWNVRVFDGQFNPAKWLEGVQQAVAAKADGILLIAIDCGPVKAALEQARAAGIKVAAVLGTDCSELNRSAKPLFDGTVQFATGGSLKSISEGIGKAQADWVTTKTKGKGKVILVASSQLNAHRWLAGGFKAELKRVCSGCRIVSQVDFAIPDLFGPGLRQKIEQALLKNPSATAFVAAIDEVVTSSGGDAAIRNTGRNNQINVIGAAAYPESLKQIRANRGLDATVAIPLEWESWAGMDTLNRVFNGKKPVSSGLAYGLVDRGHNDRSKGYISPVNYKSAYRKAWQVR